VSPQLLRRYVSLTAVGGPANGANRVCWWRNSLRRGQTTWCAFKEHEVQEPDAGRTPLPRSFGAALASVGTFSKGSRTVRCLPALPCRLRRDGTHGLIEFLLSRQSFSAALQVALRLADNPPAMGPEPLES